MVYDQAVKFDMTTTPLTTSYINRRHGLSEINAAQFEMFQIDLSTIWLEHNAVYLSHVRSLLGPRHVTRRHGGTIYVSKATFYVYRTIHRRAKSPDVRTTKT